MRDSEGNTVGALAYLRRNKEADDESEEDDKEEGEGDDDSDNNANITKATVKQEGEGTSGDKNGSNVLNKNTHTDNAETNNVIVIMSDSEDEDDDNKDSDVENEHGNDEVECSTADTGADEALLLGLGQNEPEFIELPSNTIAVDDNETATTHNTADDHMAAAVEVPVATSPSKLAATATSIRSQKPAAMPAQSRRRIPLPFGPAKLSIRNSLRQQLHRKVSQTCAENLVVSVAFLLMNSSCIQRLPRSVDS